MHRVSTSALFAGALLVSLAGSAHAQTVSSTNGGFFPNGVNGKIRTV